MSSNTVTSSDKEWKRAMEKYPIGSADAKFAAEHPYDTAEANFPNNAADPFKTDILPKQDINLDSALHEIKNVIRPSPEKVEETKKMLNNFKDKVANYPKRISYEGSMVLCVLLALSPTATVNIMGLPSEDQKIITNILPDKYLAHCSTFEVKFDDQKDFVLIFTAIDEPTHKKTTHELVVFNTIIHPTIGLDTNVPIEKDGEKVVLGSTLVLDKKRIQKLIGVERFSELPSSTQNPDEKESESIPRRQSVSGRNAYEIRADVLQMAVDWAKGKYQKTDEVLDIANKFYGFVEDRRRR